MTDIDTRALDRELKRGTAELLILSLLDATVARYASGGLSGVTSGVGYPGMSAASIIARRP